MWEPLIDGVRVFLRAAEALYGTGDQMAGPPSLVAHGAIALPSTSGAGATLEEAIAKNNTLVDLFGQLNDRDALVEHLIAQTVDSNGLSRKAVGAGSEAFESGVAAVGPFANSPFGILALLPLAAGIVTGVTDRMTSDSRLIADLAKQVPGRLADPPESARRRVVRTRGGPVILASSSQRSGSPLSAEERYRFRQRLASYTGATGSVPGLDLAMSLAGTPYAWGGFSPSGLDCSGAVAALVNYSLGLDPFAERTSTHTEAQWLAGRGALPGLGGPGDLSIGFTNAGVGHTAATLPDGTNFESSGGYGVRVGGGAAGADDPMFDEHWYIPAALLRGGGASIAV